MIRVAETQSFILEAIDRASAPLRRVSEAFGRVSAAAEQMGARAGRAASGVGKTFDEMADAAQRSGARMRDVGASLTLGLTAPLVGAGALAVKAFADYEHSLASLSKATGLTGADLDTMGQKFREIASSDLPVAANDLLAIATEGAKMGIASTELERFTRLTATMATAFDISAQDVTGQTAKVANQFKILNAATGELDFARMETFGDAVNNMADNMATSEAKILEAVSRMAGITQPLGFDENQTAALAAGFTALGMEADVASRAVNSSMQRLANAPALTEDAVAALEEMGYSAEDLQKQFLDGKGPEAYIGFLQKISGMGSKAIPLLTEIFGTGFSDEMARGGVGIEQFSKAFGLMEESISGGGATMQKSLEIMGGTSQAEFQKLKSAALDVLVVFGRLLAEAVLPLAKGLRQALIAMSEFGQTNPGLAKVIVSILAIAAAIGPVVFAIGTVQGAFAALGVFLSGGFGAALVGVVTSLTGTLAVGLTMFAQFSAGAIAAILRFTVTGAAHVLGFAIKATTAIAQFAIKATTSLIQFAAQGVAAIARFAASSIVSLAQFALRGVASVASFVVSALAQLGTFVVQGILGISRFATQGAIALVQFAAKGAAAIGWFVVDSALAIAEFVLTGLVEIGKFVAQSLVSLGKFAVQGAIALGKFAINGVLAIARFVATSTISLASFAAQGAISIAKFVASGTLSLVKFAAQAAITFAPLLLGAAALAAAGYLVYKNWDGISEVLSRAELPKADSAKLSAKIGIEVENSADIVEALFQKPLQTIGAISSAYLGAFSDIWNGFWSNLTSSIQMIGLNIQFQLTSWGVAFSAFVAGVASWVTSLGASITAVFAGIVAAFAALQSSAIAKASEITTTVVNAFEGIRATFDGLREGAIAKVAEIRDAITNAFDGVKSQIQSALSSIPNPFANLRIPSFSRGGSVGNSAQGNIPQSVAGLLSAAQREARAMPAGSALTVANTSELILNRAQYGSLLSQRARPIAIAQRENQIAFATFAPTINLNVAQTGQVDPRQIAKQVMAELDREYRQWSAGMA